MWKRFRADRRRRKLPDQARYLTDRLRGRAHPGWRWALRDVELRAFPGEAIGLVGRNGSGKSTLLKLLTRVMYPYAGQIAVGGRVGALIEVRAGIHPELTGRENVYLYGSLLGLGRKQVAERFDGIVAFAQLEDAIDRQVKFFSSGMQMRLGFAVAAFLEPDVLLVDEILAVGDAAFQQRCLDRMSAVLADGTTLILVSHDLAAVEAVCTRAIWLDEGVSRADGAVRDVLASYRHSVEEMAEFIPMTSGVVRVAKVEVSGADSQPVATGSSLTLSFHMESPVGRSATMCVGLTEGPATPIFLVRRDIYLNEGDTEARLAIEQLPLPRGRYFVWFALLAKGEQEHDLLPWHPVAHVDVSGPDLDATPRGILRLAPVHVAASWDIGRP